MQARAAARTLVSASTEQKNQALREMAVALRAASAELVAANALDLEAAKNAGKNSAFLDRLLLDAGRVEAMAAAVESVAALPDPVGVIPRLRSG